MSRQRSGEIGFDRRPGVRGVLGRLRGAGVVVAVSGGGDSVGLFRILLDARDEFNLRLIVAHLDHGARGEEGRADARFVAELVGSFGIPFELGEWRPTRPSHFEADARRARYAWLFEVARTHGASAVAVGQTLDDQAETILHRIVRGAGLRGVSGMPRRRRLAPGIALVRPLLGVTRAEIRAHLAAIGQGFREDSTNLDTTRTRARIRLELLPGLAANYNPDVAGALVRLGRLARSADRLVEEIARERLAALLVESSPDRVALDRRKLSDIRNFERAEVLRLAWRGAGWPEGTMDARRWRRLAALASSDSAKVSVGAAVEAEATSDRLVLIRRPASAPEVVPRRGPIPLPVPGSVEVPGGRVVATLDPAGAEPGDEAVDLDRLALPLVVRWPEPGDRFSPLGLGGKSQSLADFFRGRGVARADRPDMPLVCDRDGIVWVVGHRIGHPARLTDSTRRVLALRFEREEGELNRRDAEDTEKDRVNLK